MRTLHLVGLVALLGAPACYREYGSDSTMPVAPEPVSVSGPPGGAIDPGYAYEAPGQPGYPAGYPEGYSEGYPQGYPSGNTEGYAQDPADPDGSASPDPQAAGDATGTVTDEEIDQTLQPYGQWVEDEEYGRVWRPDPTVVGVDFTPYETAGSWVNTDVGWAFDCDWDWGWLPFHYGNWEWFDDYWGWVPDYTWSPAQVEWRSGGGYVGWRPLGPTIRDHRRGGRGGASGGPIVRDHRRPRKDAHWRFTTETNFGKHNVRAHIFQNPAEGLRVTSTVPRPPAHVGPTVRTSSVMRGRMNAIGGTRSPSVRNNPAFGPQPPSRSYQPPTRSTYQGPSRTYQPPAGPPRNYQPTYQPPSRSTYNPPSRSTYNPPSRSTYSPPSRSTYSPPSRSTYSPPSRSSSSSSSPSHSSSSSSPSRSSSSSSSSSHSSSSSSRHR